MIKDDREFLEFKKLPKVVVNIILDYYGNLWDVLWFQRNRFDVIEECFFCNKSKDRRITRYYENHYYH